MKRESGRRTGGFTMSEMLVTVLIFSLVSVAMAAGISSSAKAYRSSIQTSEAQTLCNTLAQTITNILHNSRDASNSATISNDFFGENVSFSSDEEGKEGRICLGGKTITGSGAYGKNLFAHVECSCVESIFTVKLTVQDRDKKQLAEAEFSVKVPEE